MEEPDQSLTPEENALVAKLSADDLKAIDEALIAQCAPTFRKVARVVGTTMNALSDREPGIPDSFYAARVAALVDQGRLESQGNLAYMRFSEVRLPGKKA